MLTAVGDLLLIYSSPSLFFTSMGMLLASALIATMSLGVHFAVKCTTAYVDRLKGEWWLPAIVSVSYPVPFIALLIGRKLYLRSGHFDTYSRLGMCVAGLLCLALVAILFRADFKEVATGVLIALLTLAFSSALVIQMWYYNTVLPRMRSAVTRSPLLILIVSWGCFWGWIDDWRGVYIYSGVVYCVVVLFVIIVASVRILPRTHDLTSRYAFLSPSPGMCEAFRVEFTTETINMGDFTIWAGLCAIVASGAFGLFLSSFDELICGGVLITCTSVVCMGLYQWVVATSSYTLLEQVRRSITKGTMQLAFSRVAHDLRKSSLYERKDAADVFYSLKQLSNSISKASYLMSQVENLQPGSRSCMSQKLDSAIDTIANAFIEWVGIPLIRVDIFRLEVIPQEGASVSECARVLAATVCKSKSAYRCVLSLMSDELHSLRLRRGRLLCYLQRAIFASVRYTEMECQARAGRFAAALAGEPSLVDTMLRGMDAYGTTAPDSESGNFYRDMTGALDYAMKNGRVLRYVGGAELISPKLPVEAEALSVLLRAFDLTFPDVFAAQFNAGNWESFFHRAVGECWFLSSSGSRKGASGDAAGGGGRAAEREVDAYCDPDFAAALSSITDVRDVELIDSMLKDLRWLRPNEIAGECVLWKGVPRPTDIAPGLLSNVFLEAVHAVCTSTPSLIVRMFQLQAADTASNTLGQRYTVRFSLGLGIWTNVTVDTRFACYPDTNQPVFAGLKNGCIWPMVIEKAFAKLRGSYSELETCDLASVISFLVGGIPECVKLERVVKSKPYVIFNQVKQWIRNGYVVCARTSPGPPLPGGLLTDRCYSLVDIKELPEGQLVKLKGGVGPHVDTGGVSEWSLAAAPRLLVYNKERLHDGLWVQFAVFLACFDGILAYHSDDGLPTECANVEFAHDPVSPPRCVMTLSEFSPEVVITLGMKTRLQCGGPSAALKVRAYGRGMARLQILSKEVDVLLPALLTRVTLAASPTGDRRPQTRRRLIFSIDPASAFGRGILFQTRPAT